MRESVPSPPSESRSNPEVAMSAPSLTEAELEAVIAVLHTPRLSMGPQVEQFEAAVAEYVGSPHAVAVSSGTTGLHLSVRAVGVSDGDLVLTTPFSFVASANVILYERAIPIFVDVDPATGNIDPEMVAQAAADLKGGAVSRSRWLPRTGAERAGELKALLPVDVFGQPADYTELSETVNRLGLSLIEDSCEALGSRYRGQYAGTLGDLGVFAFYPNKQITTGEGGMIVTAREDLADLARSLRNQGRAPGDQWLEHTHLGYNYRLNELNAALGAVQMRRVDDLIDRRAAVANAYRDRLADMDQIETLEIRPDTTRMSWFVYVIRLAPGLDRSTLAARLADRGIPSRPYFQPIHLQRYFREMFGYQEGDFPLAEDLGRRSLALPFSSVMTEEEVGQVVDALRAALADPDQAGV